MKRILNNNRGFATFLALLMVGMLTMIGLAVLSTSEDEIAITGNSLQETKAFYAAEAGLEMAAARLHFIIDSTGTVATTLPSGSDTMNDCIVTYSAVDNGPVEQRVLTTGTLSGLNALVKSYTMVATGINTVENSKVVVEQEFERALVPLFQFAVFYGNDLEIAPGPDMNLIGRVHSNGNLYLQAGSTLRMDSYVTASGNIIHGRKGPGGVDNGDVLIKDGDGDYQSMRDNGAWLDADDSYWYDSSVARWTGRVQDSTHGQGELELPLSGSGDPLDMIRPYDATTNPDSYENLATLRVIDGNVYELIGSVWSDVTSTMQAAGIISVDNDAFWDDREDNWVDVVEFNVDELYDNGYTDQVIYFSNSSIGDYPAVRINDADELGGPLTIVSENPVYTNGNFNSVDKQPAAIMADAVTFLSNAWGDNNYDARGDQDKNNRPATATTVNASIMTGNIETTSSQYNGGFENLPRFLENWNNISFNWAGSMVNLWNSQQATGNWHGGYYSPPIRNWRYDTDLDDPTKLPPEVPMVRVFQRTGWKQSHVGYVNLDENDASDLIIYGEEEPQGQH